jgi:hypothetical protein
MYHSAAFAILFVTTVDVSPLPHCSLTRSLYPYHSLIELGDGRAPWSDLPPFRALIKIVKEPAPTFTVDPHAWSAECRALVSAATVKDPELRSSCRQLTGLPFITSAPRDCAVVLVPLARNARNGCETSMATRPAGASNGGVTPPPDTDGVSAAAAAASGVSGASDEVDGDEGLFGLEAPVSRSNPLFNAD